MARYLDNAQFTVALHTLRDHEIVLIHILPHPQGACVFKSDGHVGDKLVFRMGDIYTRHGTSSTRINQHDLSRILDKRAASYIRTDAAVMRARSASGAGKQPLTSATSLFLGFAPATVPHDMARRLFVSTGPGASFQEYLWTLLERKILRRDGHTYQNMLDSGTEFVRSRGVISHVGEPDAYVSVLVRTDGTVSITLNEAARSWGDEERFAFWALGGFFITRSLWSELGVDGPAYACLRTQVEDDFVGKRELGCTFPMEHPFDGGDRDRWSAAARDAATAIADLNRHWLHPRELNVTSDPRKLLRLNDLHATPRRFREQ